VEAAFEQLTSRLMGDEPHSADDDAALARILEAINERESKLMDEAPVRACIALCCQRRDRQLLSFRCLLCRVSRTPSCHYSPVDCRCRLPSYVIR
jgi:hypothetical protein